jgi:ABC-type microcin C transport system permease subunit YejE
MKFSNDDPLLAFCYVVCSAAMAFMVGITCSQCCLRCVSGAQFRHVFATTPWLYPCLILALYVLSSFGFCLITLQLLAVIAMAYKGALPDEPVLY